MEHPVVHLGDAGNIDVGIEATQHIRLAGRGNGTELSIDSATVESGSGSMRITGRVSVDSTLALDLDAAFDEFQAIQTNAYQAAISGDLHAGGTPLAPVIEGEVTTESLDVYIDERPGDAGQLPAGGPGARPTGSPEDSGCRGSMPA